MWDLLHGGLGWMPAAGKEGSGTEQEVSWKALLSVTVRGWTSILPRSLEIWGEGSPRRTELLWGMLAIQHFWSVG